MTQKGKKLRAGNGFALGHVDAPPWPKRDPKTPRMTQKSERKTARQLAA